MNNAEKNKYWIWFTLIEGLKNKIVDIVTRGENNWQKLSENSRNIAINKFSSEKYMREFTKLYIKER